MRQEMTAVLAVIGVMVLAGCAATTTTGTAQLGVTGDSGISAPSLPSTPVSSRTPSTLQQPPVDTTQTSAGPSILGTLSPTKGIPPVAIPSTAAGGTTSDSPGKRSTAPAPTTVDGRLSPWLRDDGDAWFQTADGSARCAVGPSQGDAKPMVTCRIAKHTYHLPAAPSADCPRWGDFILLGATGPATFVCYNDSRFDTAANVLPVTGSLAFDGFTCQNGTVNVVCQRNITTEAFTVNPKEYTFWSTSDNPGGTTPGTSKPPATTRPPTSSKPPRTSKPPATTGNTAQPVTVDGHDAPWNSGSWATFQSPSGNIACVIGDLGGNGALSAECDILYHTYPTPAAPASCPLDYGDRFIVGASGKSTLGCHGDTLADPGAAVLPYGTSITYGSMACTSSTSGMRCDNQDTGHYFTVASAAYQLG